MRPLSLLASLSAGLLLALPAAAEGKREPFEMVKGWEVERTVGDTSANPCLMSHVYEDKEDNNATNGIIFALDGSNAVLALVYQGWDFEKDETRKVPLFLDKKPIKLKTTWIGDGKVLRASFPDTIVPDLLAAKSIVLRFEDGEADFRIPNFAAGYESLRRCDAAPAKAPATAAPPPPLPPQARMSAYAVGLLVQRVLKECDVSSTGKQRTAVDARMAALQPEIAPVEQALRSEMQKKGFSCPSAEQEPEFQTALRKFIELSPEALAADMEKQVETEKSAAAAPKP